MWWQKEIQLSAKARGFHLVTEEIFKQLPELSLINVGLANIFIQHTSASLTINENADYTVREDFESFLIRPFLKMSLIINMIMKEVMICQLT